MFISRKSENRISACIGAVIAAVLLAVSSLLTLVGQLDLPWAADGLLSGTVSGGLARVWNTAADTLGSTNYIILKKTAGEAPGCGLFLFIMLIVLAAAAWFAIRSRYMLALLIFVVPQISLGLICSLHAGPGIVAFLTVSVILAAALMRMESSFAQIIVLCGLTGICAFALLHAAGIEDIKDTKSTFIRAAADKIYGTDGLGNGDLSIRNRDTGTGEALKVTMSDPQPMYLKGFIGSSFNGKAWHDLSDITYYRSEETMRLLKDAGFNAPGQLAQTGNLAYGEGSVSTVGIENTGTDTRFAYVPYEITDRGDLSDSLTKGGSEFWHGKFSGFKNYSYTVSEQQTDNWTDLAALFFTKALGSSTGRDISDYLTYESHFNVFVYDNYTYVAPRHRNLLEQNIGSAGDQSKGHIDYKTAIDAIRSYLEDNFIYTDNLGGELSEKADGFDDFLTSHKGYDVQFATAATLMFRYYGIPARYVEGYLVTPAEIENAGGGSISVGRDRVHAWTEIYIDGTGFVPIEVSPPYYGVMNDADMETGISNEALMSSFSQAYGNTDQPEEEDEQSEIRLNDGGDEALQLLWITLIIAFCVAAAVGLFFLLKALIPVIAAYYARRKLFNGKDTKKAAAAIYGYMEESGLYIKENVKELGNRAAYSREEISEEERTKMLEEYKAARKLNKRTGKAVPAVFLAAFILFNAVMLAACGGGSSAAKNNAFPDKAEKLTEEIAAYLMEQVPGPGPGSVGGDWLIKGLAESGADIPQSYYDLYYDSVRAEVKSKKGVLSEDHYTEYERVIIGLSAIGKDTVVEGYDLAPYLDEFDKVTAQGVNASCFALIAAHDAGITLQNEDAYIEDILNGMNDEEIKDNKAYADYIAIALEALSFYQDRQDIKEFTAEKIDLLSSLQEDDGSYGSCESTAECIMALGRLGIDPDKDTRFKKNNKSLPDGLMVYYLGDGKFCHTLEYKDPDLMSAEKALLAADVIRMFRKTG